MSNYHKKIKLYIWFIVIVFIVCYGWQGLELLIYKEIQHRTVDDIIAFVLVVSIMLNLVFVNKFTRIITFTCSKCGYKEKVYVLKDDDALGKYIFARCNKPCPRCKENHTIVECNINN